MDYWAEDKAASMENESIKKDFGTVQKELNAVQGAKFYKRHLLNSMS